MPYQPTVSIVYRKLRVLKGHTVLRTLPLTLDNPARLVGSSIYVRDELLCNHKLTSEYPSSGLRVISLKVSITI